MKSALKWGSLCLVTYFIFLIVKLPAVQVLSHVQLPKGVSVSGVTGTVWQGQAQRAQANGLPINNLNWSLSFMPLLFGQISVDIKAGNVRDTDQISATGHISISGQRLQADDLLIYIPTNLVMGLLPLPIPVNANGRFKVQLNEVDYAAGCQVFAGKGQWLNANYSGATGLVELGNFDADLGCLDGNIIMHVKPPNSFSLTAKAIIPANMKFKIEGRFKPDANLPKEVHQAATFLGKADAQGYYPINF